jgi:hypothetical protein
MSASKAKAGEAYVEISTRNGLLNKGLAAAQASMRRLAASTNAISATMGRGFMAVGGTMSSIASSAMSLKGALAGAMAASGVGMMVKGFADAAGNIDDMAKRTGLAAEEIQGLSFAAKMSGTSIEAVEGAIRKMQKSGFSTGRGPMADFRTLADNIAAISDPALRASEAMKYFGRSGTALLPMFENGSAGIDKLIGEAESLGIVMSNTDISMGEQLGDTLDTLWTTLGGVANQIGAVLAPIIDALAQRIISITSTVSNWIKENRALIDTVMDMENFGLMAEIGMTAFEIALTTGMQPIYNLWTDLYTWIASSAVDAVTSIVNVFAGIPTALMNGFSTVITWLTGTWDRAVNGIAKSLLYLYSLFDRSVDYEATAKQMDKDAMARAGQRQKDLDAVKTRRNEDLDRANQSRAEYADGIKTNMRQDADARKSDFDSRVQQLGNQIADQMAELNKRAEDRDATNAAAEEATKGREAKPVEPPSPGLVAEEVAVKTQGTFSGFAAGMLGTGGSAIDRLEKETKSQTKILQAIAENTATDDSLELS